MKVTLILMRTNGVARRRVDIRDPHCTRYQGELSLRETTNQGLNRLSLVASLILTGSLTAMQLYDARLVWIEDNRLMLTGLEFHQTQYGQVAYAQSWLCIIDPCLNHNIPNTAIKIPEPHTKSGERERL